MKKFLPVQKLTNLAINFLIVIVAFLLLEKLALNIALFRLMKIDDKMNMKTIETINKTLVDNQEMLKTTVKFCVATLASLRSITFIEKAMKRRK